MGIIKAFAYENGCPTLEQQQNLPSNVAILQNHQREIPIVLVQFDDQFKGNQPSCVTHITYGKINSNRTGK